MAATFGLPDRITQQENGSYLWVCSIEPDYYRKNMALGFRACLIIAAFVLLFGAALAYQYRDWKQMWIVGACAAVFLIEYSGS